MSVYNRKMFKPRNARNALNMSAGIAPVQKFHAGGPVGHTHPPAGSVFNVARQQITQPTFQSVQSPSGRRFMFPPTSPTLSGATDIGLAKKAFKGGLGSLSIPEQMYTGASQGKLRGRDAASGVKSYLGNSVLGEIAETVAELGGTAAGGISGLASGLISDSTGSQDSLAGRFGSMEPSDEYLASVGARPADPDPANFQTASAMGRSFPPKPVDPSSLLSQLGSRRPPPVGGPVDPGNSLDMSDPQVRARLEQARRAREITEAGGDVVVDPNTGEVTSSTGQSIAELLKRAQPDPVVETESFDINTDDQDPVRPKSKADPAEPDPEEPAAAADRDEADNKTAAIVAQAKSANAKAGVPQLTSDQDEIDTAAQAGTGSAEDIKAEFLKLLPKYEEDPSIQGLNLAMMGFAIAGGESSNAMKNIADGMKKTLPAFIKSKEKRKAFERETDLLASKYAIQRKEGDRNRGFAKNDYYVTKDFVGPDNQKYTAGQPLKLNDAAFSVMEKQGLTGNLVSGTIYGKMLDNNAKVEKARLASKPTSYHQKSSKTLDIGGNKIEVYYPTADAPEGTKAFPAGRQEGWKSFTGKYTTQLEQLSFGQKSLSTAKGILSKGNAVGSAGAFGKALDATKAFVPRSIGERMGLDYDNLSSANELENLNRTLALQLAKPLLQEGGKTISNFERMQVAKALGYSDAAVDSTGTIILGNMNNMFTTQADAENRIGLIEGILQRSAEKLHSDYKDTATLFGYELTTPEQAVASAPSGSLGNLEQRDDGKFYFVTGQ